MKIFFFGGIDDMMNNDFAEGDPLISKRNTELNELQSNLEITADLISASQFNSAYELNNNTYERALVLDEPSIICICLNNFAQITYNLGNIESSLAFATKAYHLSKNYGDESAAILALNGCARIYTLYGNYQKALQTYNEAYDIIKQYPAEEKRKSMILNNIGLAFQALNMFDEAESHYHDALDSALSIGDETFPNSFIIPILYGNLAENNLLKKNYIRADVFLSLARSTSVELEDKIGIAYCDFIEASIINSRDHDFAKAQLLFIQALEFIKENGVYSEYVELLIKYGKQAYIADELALAKDILENSLHLVTEHKYNQMNPDIIELLEKIYHATGETKKAYEMLQKRYTHLDYLYKQGNLRNELTFVGDNLTSSDQEESLQLKELKRALKTMKMLAEIGQSITSCLDSKQILMVLNDSFSRFMQLSSFGIGVVDKTTDTLNLMAYDDHIYNEFSIPMNNTSSFMVSCILKNQEIVIYNTDEPTTYSNQLTPNFMEILKNTRLKSLLFCPMVTSNAIIGGVTVQSYTPYSFSYVDLEALRVLTSYIAIAINNINKSNSLLEMNRKLESIAQIDSLTGLLNRRALAKYISKTFNATIIESLPISVFMIDLDYFKQYNDYYGHQSGDNCLVDVTSTIIGALDAKKSDHSTFRFGGDEFLVLIKHCDETSCRLILDDILEKIYSLNITHERSKISDRVTLTIGASVIKRPIEDYTIAFQSSDEALYAAKNSGRNNYVIHSVE